MEGSFAAQSQEAHLYLYSHPPQVGWGPAALQLVLCLPLLEGMLASLCSDLNRRIIPRSLAAPLQSSVFWMLLALLEVMSELGCL
jgi:hypothetical protein